MESLLLLATALLPFTVLLLYIWKNDTKKEPSSWLMKAFLWGIVIFIPVIIVEYGISYMLLGEDGGASSFLGAIAKACIFGLTIDFATAAIISLIFIIFFVKQQKFANKKVTTLFERDKQNIYRT